MKVKRASDSRNVFQVEVEAARQKDWVWWCLLSSDRHWDNPKSDQKLQKKHLEQVIERDGAWLCNGDLFCAMAAKADKRGAKSLLRPEHNVDHYFDALVDTAVEWFAPYASRCIMLGAGNHEKSVKKYHEISLTERLCQGLTAKANRTVFNGGYSGDVQFQFKTSKRRLNTVTLNYRHGSGGGGPVTANMIDFNRKAMVLPDADIIIQGHVHDAWMRYVARARLSERGVRYHDLQTWIQCTTYKEEYRDGFGGWHVETGKPPKPIGAWWLKFWYDGSQDRVVHDVIFAR